MAAATAPLVPCEARPPLHVTRAPVGCRRPGGAESSWSEELADRPLAHVDVRSRACRPESALDRAVAPWITAVCLRKRGRRGSTNAVAPVDTSQPRMRKRLTKGRRRHAERPSSHFTSTCTASTCSTVPRGLDSGRERKSSIRSPRRGSGCSPSVATGSPLSGRRTKPERRESNETMAAARRPARRRSRWHDSQFFPTSRHRSAYVEERLSERPLSHFTRIWRSSTYCTVPRG
jgi:hypothetical protein